MNSETVPSKKPSRQGRYRKQLFDPDAIAPFAKKLENAFQSLRAHLQNQTLSEAEFFGYSLLALLACRRPDAIQKSSSLKKLPLSQNIVPNSFPLGDFIILLQENNLPIIAFDKFLPSLSLMEFLTQIRFRGIPFSAQQALMEWLKQNYPLQLFFHSPTVSEVFALQKNGGRCITFFTRAEELIRLHHERDALSFSIHDLIHAHEFYSDPKRARQQIGFYHWMDSLIENPHLQRMLKSSPNFEARWEYLLADMNSYCGHLLKTLHAIILIESGEDEEEGRNIWRDLVENSSLNPAAKILFLKTNQHSWCDQDFIQLEEVLERL